MPSKNKTKVTLYVETDVADFVRNYGGHRSTDLSQGRVNVSAEVNDYLKRLMAKMSPETVGYQLARRKEELSLEMEAIDREAQELFGFSTIEEWLAQQAEKDRTEAQRIALQVQIREEIKTEIWERLTGDYRSMRRGRFTPKADQAWLASRFKQELRILGLTAVEALARLEREINKGPEVA